MNTTGDMKLDAFAARLKTLAGPDTPPENNFTARIMAKIAAERRKNAIWRRLALPAAAAAVLAAAVLPFFELAAPRSPSPAPRSPFPAPYSFAVSGDIDSILRTQEEDGSWRLARLTQSNAAVLGRAAARPDASGEVRRAYRRALRWMRLSGVPELTPAQFRELLRSTV